MGKFNIRLLKISIKEIGFMGKEMDSEASSMLMDAGTKDISIKIKNMAMDLFWIKMEILNFNFSKKINLFTRFLKRIL
jgi:hypothetical protein